MLGPLDLAGNRKSARHVTSEGWVQPSAIGVHAVEDLIGAKLNIVILYIVTINLLPVFVF